MVQKTKQRTIKLFKTKQNVETKLIKIKWRDLKKFKLSTHLDQIAKIQF